MPIASAGSSHADTSARAGPNGERAEASGCRSIAAATGLEPPAQPEPPRPRRATSTPRPRPTPTSRGHRQRALARSRSRVIGDVRGLSRVKPPRGFGQGRCQPIGSPVVAGLPLDRGRVGLERCRPRRSGGIEPRRQLGQGRRQGGQCSVGLPLDQRRARARAACSASPGQGAPTSRPGPTPRGRRARPGPPHTGREGWPRTWPPARWRGQDASDAGCLARVEPHR